MVAKAGRGDVMIGARWRSSSAWSDLECRFLDVALVRTGLLKYLRGEAGLIRPVDIQGHPLGFSRLYLRSEQLPKNWSLVVNLWPDTLDDEVVGDVHDHCYDFSSLILSGSLQHRTFSLTSKERGIKYFLTDYVGGSSVNATVDGASDTSTYLDQSSQFVASHGQKYHMAHTTLHFAQSIKQNTMSLQLQGPKRKNLATVLKPQSPKNGLAAPTSQASVDMAGTAERLLEVIA